VGGKELTSCSSISSKPAEVSWNALSIDPRPSNVRDKPVLGWGLGTFLSYILNSAVSTPTFVNVAHNDSPAIASEMASRFAVMVVLDVFIAVR
jgi:hypothetical protein